MGGGHGTLWGVSTRRRIILSVLAALVVLVVVLTDRWFVHPDVDDPGVADAIFVLGGQGDRESFAVDLARDGAASLVVYSSVYLEQYDSWAADPCNEWRRSEFPAAITFVCVEADPATTRGEARLLRDLAEESDWDTVVVVASTDQITRARRLIGRCWDGEVRLTGPDHSGHWAMRALYEWGASLKATALRGC